MTLEDVTKCRTLTRGFRLAIDILPQYKDIVTFASSILRAVLSLEIASYFTCAELHNALCSKKCENCGQFGPFLYLLRCERVCYECMTTIDDYLPLKPAHAMQKVAVKKKDFNKYDVPTARCLPGRYDRLRPRKHEKGGTQLVDFKRMFPLFVTDF
ncbi:hypothetical protein D0Z07_7213 [Hyphodiscus hymeniophilus]|uniref:Uncharacterized protein n=1 Tax=Hyphodiscus hymeniophilus TaxID=353542 RepID=A0A9P7AVA0_9HELO|nr:hypothetical protein D0Z07_7213 [Hyphodiscus hymeniophilus]